MEVKDTGGGGRERSGGDSTAWRETYRQAQVLAL